MADVTWFPPSSILANHSHHIYHPSPPLPQPIAHFQAQYHQQSNPITHGQGTTMAMAFPPGPSRASTSRNNNFASSATCTTYLRSPFSSSYSASFTRRRTSHIPLPPKDGSSPMSHLPDELLISVLSFLPQQDILRVRLVNKRSSRLAVHPSLHRSLTLLSLPTYPLPPLLADHILPSLHHLHLHLFPNPPHPRTSSSSNRHRDAHTRVISELFQAIRPDQLISLSLPFSAPYLAANEISQILGRIGGRLEKLDLRGSGLVGAQYLDWLGQVGSRGRGLKELDLGFTSISALPGASHDEELDIGLPTANGLNGLFSSTMTPPRSPTQSQTWSWSSSLTHLSLASCSSLSTPVLAAFLSQLPSTLQSLDLSRLEQVTLQALWDMKVIDYDETQAKESLSLNNLSGSGAGAATALREIKLVGIDHLTRSDIRQIKTHWEAQRRAVRSIDGEDEDLPKRGTGPWQWSKLSHRDHQMGGLPLQEAIDPPGTRVVRHRPSTASFLSQEPLTPELSSSLRSNSSASNSSFSFSSRSISPIYGPGLSLAPSGTDDRYGYRNVMTMPRASVVSTHTAFWQALSQDADDGMIAEPDVWGSKLPNHPELPTLGGRVLDTGNTGGGLGISLGQAFGVGDPSFRENPRAEARSSGEPNTMLQSAVSGGIASSRFCDDGKTRVPSTFQPSSVSPTSRPEPRQRHSGWDGVSISITHSAILESEDEDGYRRFIGEVAGGVVDPGQPGAEGTGLMGLGLGLGM